MVMNKPSYLVRIEVSKLVKFNLYMKELIRKIIFFLGVSTFIICNI